MRTELCLLLLLLPFSARADDAACQDAARKVIARTLARQTEVTPEFHNIVLSHPNATDVRVMCSPGTGQPQLLMTLDGEPTPQFLTLVAAAAAAIRGLPEKGLAKLVGDCLVAAALDPTQAADRVVRATKFECFADSRSRNYSVTVMSDGD